jgi:hypothetical protein
MEFIMSNIKLKFDKDSNFESKYVVMAKSLDGQSYDETELGRIKFNENGKIDIMHNGFSFSFSDIDELEVVISPLDVLFSKVKFKLKKMDGSDKVIPVNFYGIRGTNVFISYDNEIGGDETDQPDDLD